VCSCGHAQVVAYPGAEDAVDDAGGVEQVLTRTGGCVSDFNAADDATKLLMMQ